MQGMNIDIIRCASGMCLNPLTNSCQARGTGDLDYFHCSCTGTGFCI